MPSRKSHTPSGKPGGGDRSSVPISVGEPDAESGQNRYSAALGPRAERTRRKLIETASRLFREKGYLNTSVSDITSEAGVSLATFYVYFAERGDVVTVLLNEVIDDVVARGVSHWDPRSGRMGLARVVEPYVESFVEHVDFFRLWQSVIHVDQSMMKLYVDFNAAYQDRFGGYLREGVELGIVRSDLDPAWMAKAMTLMMERYCYDVFIVSPPPVPPSVAETASLITTMWADAIDLGESDVRPRHGRVTRRPLNRES